MSKYINADKLKEFIATHDYLLSDKWNSTDKGMFTCGIMQAIDEQPTADVRENVRGEWIKYGDKYKCNKCFATMQVNPINPKLKDRFCYFCGADMRKYLKHADSDTARGGLASAT